jgi:transposase-like protein
VDQANENPSESVTDPEPPPAKKEPVMKPKKKQPAKKSPVKNKKVKTAKRYSGLEKARIVRSVLAYDKANGRGGMAQAVKRFGVGFVTVKKWLEKSKAKTMAAKPATEKAPAIVKRRKVVRRKRIQRNQATVILKGSLRHSLNACLDVIERLEMEIRQSQEAMEKEKQVIKKLIE